MKLVIVESPTKAKTIAKFLGNDFIIESSYGHVRDLPISAMGIEIEDDFKREKNKLINIQHCLFVIGANLASVQAPIKNIPKLKSLEVKKLEKWIDKMEKDLPKLTNFILPGGSEESAKSFYVRAICRRAERRVIDLSLKYKSLPRSERSSTSGVDQNIMKYLNRLSDLLFVLGRWLNLKSGVKEVKWRK